MTWSSRESGRPAKPGVGTSQFSTRDVDFARPILDGPRQHGFDYFFGVGSSMNHGPYTFIKNERVVEIPDRFRKETKVNGRPFREGWIAPSWDDTRQDSVVADRALVEPSGRIESSKVKPALWSAAVPSWPMVK